MPVIAIIDPAIIDPWKSWFGIFPDVTCEVQSLVGIYRLKDGKIVPADSISISTACSAMSRQKCCRQRIDPSASRHWEPRTAGRSSFRLFARAIWRT